MLASAGQRDRFEGRGLGLICHSWWQRGMTAFVVIGRKTVVLRDLYDGECLSKLPVSQPFGTVEKGLTLSDRSDWDGAWGSGCLPRSR
jgi:hypothetical protein